MRLQLLSDLFHWPRAPRRGSLNAGVIGEGPFGYTGPVERPLHREPDRPPLTKFEDFLPSV